MPLLYTEHEGRVLSGDDRFEHVMAITLDLKSGYKEGIVRCITSRSGDVALKGNIDRSELYKIKGDSLSDFKIGEKLNIKNEEEIIANLVGEDDFLGLEDPDIWIDKEKNLMHVYFTIPIKPGEKNKNIGQKTKVYLGHAIGRDLNSLEMTKPVLMDPVLWAKEVSIAPKNSNGFRYNLIESNDLQDNVSYSIVRVAVAEDMGSSWEFGEILFHPKDYNLSWISGHASPGPLFPKTFIDVGAGKLLGVINGCGANKKVGDKIMYRNFSIGLFIYDYENGKIDWVSESPFIIDSEAGKGGNRAIAFASQFVETGLGEGILYAHVDDSFVRAYTLKAELLKPLLP